MNETYVINDIGTQGTRLSSIITYVWIVFTYIGIPVYIGYRLLKDKHTHAWRVVNHNFKYNCMVNIQQKLFVIICPRAILFLNFANHDGSPHS